MIFVDHSAGQDAVILPEVLDLNAATPLAQAILVRRGGALELDASAVRRLGGLCLQVLMSADATWSADGQALSVLNPSPAFVEGWERLGASSAA